MGQAAPVPITVEPFTWAGDLPGEDLAALTRAYNEVWDEWVPGERPISTAAFVDLDRFTAAPEQYEQRLARDDRGQVVGFAKAYWRVGPGGCTFRLFIDPTRRGEGAARSLWADLTHAARAAGRSGITVEPVAGSRVAALAEAKGFGPDLHIELNRTEVQAIPGGRLEGWRTAGEAAAGYSLVAYDAPCPPELAADFVHARHVMNDAPRPEGEAEVSYTVEELQALEAASTAAHLGWWNLGVRHDPSGELVGISDIYLPSERPWIAFQGDTGVAPAHRGHGLGAWMKAVNHLRLRDERPAVEVVQTWNAASNEPMLRINRALGFRPVQRFQAWHLPLT